MKSFIHTIGTVAAAAVCFTIYIYATAMMHAGYYAGAWPIFLYYTLLFPTALLLPIRNGINTRFFIALIVTVIFNFLFIFVANGSIETLRTVLFVRGVPTPSGVILQTSLCTMMLVCAAGLSAIVRDARRLLKENI